MGGLLGEAGGSAASPACELQGRMLEAAVRTSPAASE